MACYWDEVLADNPTVLLKMDETVGTLVDAQVGNNAVVSGTSLVYGASGPDPVGIPRAVTFAVGSLATIADSADIDLGDGPFTIEVWFKRAAAGVQTYPILKDTSYVTEFRPTNLYHLSDGSASSHVSSTTADTDLGWHHWVAVRPLAATGSIYRDGVDVTTFQVVRTFADGTVNLLLGSGLPGNEYIGGMAGLAIYKSALSAARISAHYAARSTPCSTGIKSSYSQFPKTKLRRVA